MSFQSLLYQRASILRNTASGKDTHGAPNETWTAVYTSVPCRLANSRGKEVLVKDQNVIEDNVLFMGASADVTERDKILLDGVTYEILFVDAPRNATAIHHKQLSLRTVR
jgi:hypothetical protein